MCPSLPGEEKGLKIQGFSTYQHNNRSYQTIEVKKDYHQMNTQISKATGNREF